MALNKVRREDEEGRVRHVVDREADSQDLSGVTGTNAARAAEAGMGTSEQEEGRVAKGRLRASCSLECRADERQVEKSRGEEGTH
eukprot:767470-Hanusia_phi.AAC.7